MNNQNDYLITKSDTFKYIFRTYIKNLNELESLMVFTENISEFKKLQEEYDDLKIFMQEIIKTGDEYYV